jgi:hypothetical protein
VSCGQEYKADTIGEEEDKNGCGCDIFELQCLVEESNYPFEVEK